MKFHFLVGQMGTGFLNKGRRVPLPISIDPGTKEFEQLARFREFAFRSYGSEKRLTRRGVHRLEKVQAPEESISEG